MSARERLPNRRFSESFGVACAGLRYTATPATSQPRHHVRQRRNDEQRHQYHDG
jgi:hypothetical protein